MIIELPAVRKREVQWWKDRIGVHTIWSENYQQFTGAVYHASQIVVWLSGLTKNLFNVLFLLQEGVLSLSQWADVL